MTSYSQSKLTGFWVSNMAEIGFFVTKLQLYPDSTFKYEFSGDLAYDKATGVYRLERNILYFQYDSVKIDKTDFVEILQNRNNKNRPKQLLYRNNKFWFFNSNGKVVKYGKGQSRHKKYLLFGDNYLKKRRQFLEKRDGELVFRGAKVN